MSDAKVRFETEDYDPAEPGQEQLFGFNCPFRDKRCEGLVIAGRTKQPRHPQGKHGGSAQWDWDGNRDQPTFSPSVNCGVCHWHGYIRKGRAVDCLGMDEPEIARPRTS